MTIMFAMAGPGAGPGDRNKTVEVRFIEVEVGEPIAALRQRLADTRLRWWGAAWKRIAKLTRRRWTAAEAQVASEADRALVKAQELEAAKDCRGGPGTAAPACGACHRCLIERIAQLERQAQQRADDDFERGLRSR